MNETIDNALSELRQGRFIVLLDDVGTSGGAYLLCTASSITSESVCFMVNEARGIVCAALSESRVCKLHLPMMSDGATLPASPDFTISVEARRGVTTGISASDRARTLRTLAGTSDPRRDLVMPGHIFPIRAKNGGVLVRHGIAEAAVDLLYLADLVPVAALCNCLGQDGEILQLADIEGLAARHKLPIVTLSDVVEHRMSTESLIEKVADSSIPVENAGAFRAIAFRSRIDGAEHLALVKGEVTAANNASPVLVRVQAEHRVGDLIGSASAPSRTFVIGALKRINDEGRGVFVYIRHPRKGFLAKQVLNLTDNSTARSPTSELRQTGIGAQILLALGLKEIKLLTSSERSIPGLKAFDLNIVERVPLRLH